MEQYMYYNSGNSLGIIGVRKDSIGHEDGKYTFLRNRQPDFCWILTEDLHYSYDQAEMSVPARFLNPVAKEPYPKSNYKFMLLKGKKNKNVYWTMGGHYMPEFEELLFESNDQYEITQKWQEAYNNRFK